MIMLLAKLLKQVAEQLNARVPDGYDAFAVAATWVAHDREACTAATHCGSLFRDYYCM